MVNRAEARAGPARIVRAAALQLSDHALTERYAEEWLGNLHGRSHYQQWRDALSLLMRGARAMKRAHTTKRAHTPLWWLRSGMILFAMLCGAAMLVASTWLPRRVYVMGSSGGPSEFVTIYVLGQLVQGRWGEVLSVAWWISTAGVIVLASFTRSIRWTVVGGATVGIVAAMCGVPLFINRVGLGCWLGPDFLSVSRCYGISSADKVPLYLAMEIVVSGAAVAAALGLCLHRGASGIRFLAGMYLIGVARFAVYDPWVRELTNERLINEIAKVLNWFFPTQVVWGWNSGGIIIVASEILVLAGAMLVILGVRVMQIVVSLHRAGAPSSSEAKS